MRTRMLSMLMLVTLSVTVLAACGGAPAATAPTAIPAGATAPVASGPASAGAIKFLSVQAEAEGYTGIVNKQTQDYTMANPGGKYEFEQTPQADLDQKIQLLAASNSLPLLFASPANATLKEMHTKGLVLEVEQTFWQLGLGDTLKPVALDLVRNLGGGTALGIPMELNIEGIWYNKQIFADNSIAVPTTWEQLLAAAEKLSAAGIQPFAASGEQGWPLTRLIGLYAQRKYGADAMERVDRGELKLTDSGFVEAAQAIQDLGTKGFFGEGVNTIDYATAVDLFVQGKAAMFYMGSWELRTFNDAAKTPIGAQNIGLFNFPAVRGGAGTLDDWSMNAGLTLSLGRAAYQADQAAADSWLKGVFASYGDRSMRELGAITGFKVESMPADVPPLTRSVQAQIDSAKKPMLWFEARFDSEASTMSNKNVQLLVTGDMSAEEFMGELQKVLE